ncbi:MAG: OmpA family protein [Kiloniellales bacterium]
MKTFGLGVVVAATMVLAGCEMHTFDLIDLRESEVGGGTPFTQALHKEYLELANHEADVEYDWVDADEWAEKGLMAAAGQAPEPELPQNWQRSTPGMAPTRDRLMAVFAKNATEKFPDLAARAQVQYDCWLEEQDEAWQTDRIEACRDAFLAALEELEEGMKPKPPPKPEPMVKPEPPPKPMVKVEPAPPPPRVMSFIIFFDFDSAAITPQAGRILDEVAVAYKEGKRTIVELAGHADRSGPEAYNQRLSQRRAEAAKAALIQRGVPVDAIATSAFGETRPRVPTPDGVREQENRRVEIEVR